MHPDEILSIFEKTEALLKGHFQLASGLHSDQYFQCAKVLQHPTYAELFGRAIAELYKNENITLVVGPALGGIVIGYEVARALGAQSIFAERVDGKMQVRRGFEVKPSDSVLVVEDVITTGGSAQEVVQLLESQCKLKGVASIIDRSSAPPAFTVPFKSLMKMTVKTYQPSECPLCAKQIPVAKPGTKALLK